MRWKRSAIIVLAILIVSVGLYFFNPTLTWFAPKCIFKVVTGLSCPGCGIQRFIHAFLHGRFLEAISYNYYLAYSLPYLAILCFIWALKDGAMKKKLYRYAEHPYAIIFYIVSFAGWFVIRNILHI